MTTKLYMEAIAEAKQLKHIAEQNAKNKILEALTPQIQSLVEQQLLYEQDIESEEEFTEIIDDPAVDVIDSAMVGLGSEVVDELIPVQDDEPDEMEAEDATVVVQSSGEVNINVSENNSERRNSSKALMNAPRLSGKNLTEAIKLLKRKVRRMDSLLESHGSKPITQKQRAVIQKSFKKLLAQAVYLQESIIVNSNKQNKQLRVSLLETIKEIKIMKDRRSSTIFSRLFEGDDGALDEMQYALSEQEEELDLDVEEEAEEEETFEEDVPVDKEAAETALADLGSALGLDVTIAQQEEEVTVDVEEEEDEDIELDLEEWNLAEADDMEEEEKDLDEVYEIDESVLRRELLRMRKLREADVPADIIDQFGGGDDEGELYIDVDEDDLINALADELGDPSVPAPKVESRRRQRRTGRRSARPSRLHTENRNLSTKLKKANAQLNEMNLFNAKLLYVNKLMQNKNLTAKQQRAIVEALDNAKTIREAKVLYQGLAKSLKRKSLKEGATRRTLGSASKSTRRSSMKMNESKSGGVTDRWALLAGINKK